VVSDHSMAWVLRLHHGGRHLKDNTRYAASQPVQQAYGQWHRFARSGAINRQTACVRCVLYARPSVSLRRRPTSKPRKAKPRPSKPISLGSGTGTVDLPIKLPLPSIG